MKRAQALLFKKVAGTDKKPDEKLCADALLHHELVQLFVAGALGVLAC